jgi:hypothetical protein
MDDRLPAHWASHENWEPLFDVLEDLEDTATVAKTITRDGTPMFEGIDEERMARLAAALHSMPNLIAKALLLASALPGYVAPPTRRPSRPPERLYDALGAAERLDIEPPVLVGETEIVPDPNLPPSLDGGFAVDLTMPAHGPDQNPQPRYAVMESHYDPSEDDE